METQTWCFDDENGNSITQGWQGTEEQARRKAAQLAADCECTVGAYLLGDDSEGYAFTVSE